MRRTALLAFALLSLGVVVLLAFFLGRENAAGTPLSGPVDDLVAPAEATPSASMEGALEPLTASTEPAPARQEAATEDAAPVHSAEGTCVVLGRVVDEDGAPLQDVQVRLQAYQEWARDVEVPRLPDSNDMRGFQVATDADGAFRIEAPPPTAPRTTLEIAPDRFHDSHTVRFEAGQSRAQPALTSGVRDLGEIRLATTGAVRGRVVTEEGRPLANVRMDVGPSRGTTYSRGARTEADGTFLIAHAPVGTYAVKAKADGFLSGYLEPVTVEARRDTTGIDFVLAAAPSIEGTVVDEHGGPVAGARLHGWPSTSGSGAGATSGADGSFVVFLPQEEPYTLSAKCEGFRTWGDEHGKSVTYPPGTRGLRIVMESMPRTRFLVVDAETGEAIETFGLNILQDNGSQSPTQVWTERRPPRPQEHLGGIAEATARPGLDLFVIAAEGYLLATGDVAHDGRGAPEAPLQTVRMQRGATVRGRVLRGGQAHAGALVEVERGYPSEGGAFQPRDSTRSSTSTDVEGRFALTALAPGDHRLTVRPRDGAPLVLVPVRIANQQELDLGDLILVPGAAVAGEVLLPPGVDPAGLRVYLDDWRDDVTTVVDGQGRFRFEDLAPGAHTLTLDGRPGVLAGSDAVGIELVSGETLSVTLDARDRSICAVTLTLELAGLPVSGRQVDLVSTDESREREALGHCDESGLVTGSVRAWGEAKVVVHLPGVGAVEHPEVRLQLLPRESVERTVRFEFARLLVQLPAGVTLPEDGTATLQLVSAAPARNPQRAYANFSRGKLTGAATAFVHAGAGEFRCNSFLPGTFELTLDLVDDAAELQRISVEGGGVTYERPAYYRATQEVVLLAGEALTLQLE